MIQRTPSSKLPTYEGEKDVKDDDDFIPPSISRTSLSEQARDTIAGAMKSTRGTADYVARYSTAMLHHVVSESVWLNMKNLPIRVLRFIAFI